MIKKFTIEDETGLHARPASKLVKEANKYSNEIKLIYQDKTINLKSIMMVISLGIPHKASFKIEVIGQNAETALTALENVLKKEGSI